MTASDLDRLRITLSLPMCVLFFACFKNFHCYDLIAEFILCGSIKSIVIFLSSFILSFLCVYFFVSQGH